MKNYAKFIFLILLASFFIACGGGGSGGGGNPGTLQFNAASYSGSEDAGAITVSVTRTGGSDGAVSVILSDNGSGTATSGTDYTAIAATTLSWDSGDSSAKTFSVSVTSDAVFEADETAVLSLGSATGGAVLGRATTTVTILNDDPVPSNLQFDSSSYNIKEGVGPVTITVTRTGGNTGAASVTYTTSDGSAKAGADYTATTDVLNWGSGDSAAKSFQVAIVDDGAAEPIKSFNIALSNVTGATLGTPGNTTVMITDDDLITIPVSGTVRAPNGNLAYREPGLLQHMLAMLFGDAVNAAIIDLVSPVVGASVSVYEIDASGSLVGTAYDITTTDGSGNFTLNVPSDALNSVKYIIRATGTTETMDSRVSSDTVNVDPSTDATSRLVTSVVSNLADISLQEVIEMQVEVERLIADIDKTGLNATLLSDRLFNRAQSRVGLYNVLRSKVSLGKICGHVQTVSVSPLEGILITVRDYVDRTVRARTYTDAGGDYCLNVPVQGDSNPDGGTFNGEYIIGAINRTNDASISASEWFGSGTTYTMDEASKILVANTTPVTGTNFTLESGARISGTVKAEITSVGLEGIQVVIRDFNSRRRLAATETAADGSYSVSVVPGTYLIVVRNQTTAAYSSEVYAPTFITNPSWVWGESVSATAGQTVNIDHVLEAGFQISGNVNDGTPVVAEEVVIDWAGGLTVEKVSTDRNGDYSIWLKANDNYDIYAHGQRSKDVLLGANTTLNFTTPASSLSTISGQLTDGSNPVHSLAIRLHRLIDPLNTFLRGYASIDVNGNFKLLTDETGAHILEMRVTKEVGVGSIIYNNKTQLLGGDIVGIASVGSSQSLGTVTIPAGGILKGHVYDDSSVSTPPLFPFTNMRVQVRDGGVLPENRFLQVRVRADGSYIVALPAGVYERVKMRDAYGGSDGNCDGITITAGVTTVLNYYNGDNVCEVNP